MPARSSSRPQPGSNSKANNIPTAAQEKVRSQRVFIRGKNESAGFCSQDDSMQLGCYRPNRGPPMGPWSYADHERD